MIMPPGPIRQLLLFALLVTVFAQDDEYDPETTASPFSSMVESMMPSNETGEKIGLQFLDAVIKRGQLEMAKRTYQTQLELLERTDPDKFDRLKEMPVDEMALGAVRQQAYIGQFQKPTGNKLLDVLNRNGIPVASSIKSVEQAIKKQDELKKDPKERIAEAVVDKLRKEVIPKIVGSLIAGENPFDKLRTSPEGVRRSEGHSFARRNNHRETDVIGYQPFYSDPEHGRADSFEPPAQRLLPWAPTQPLIPDEMIAEALGFPAVTNPPYNNNRYAVNSPFAKFADQQAQYYQPEPSYSSDSVAGIRRSPRKLSPQLVEMLRQSPELAAIVERQLGYDTDFDQKSSSAYLTPSQIQRTSTPQWPPVSGFQFSKANTMDTEDQRRRRPAESQMSPLTELILKLRSLPKLPNIFGGDSAQTSQSGERSSIWTPPVVASTPSYFANPLADALYSSSSAQSSPFFSDVRRDENRSGKDESTANDYPSLRRSPRRHTISTSSSASAPLGKHTRFRITGTTEEGSPGVDGQFVLPSVDPAVPAFNGMLSSQDKTRQEYIGTLKLPNEWLKGDSIGASLSTRTRKINQSAGGMDLAGFNVDLDDVVEHN